MTYFQNWDEGLAATMLEVLMILGGTFVSTRDAAAPEM